MDEARQLYEKFLAGDTEALTRLVEEFANPLILFIYTYVKDYHLAEDLMEDCFVELLAKKPAFRGESKFKSFLFQIGKNKALNHLKRSRIITWIAEDQVPHELKEDPGILEELVTGERELRLHRAIRQLPPDQARALQLVYFQEFSYEDAARAMGKTKKQIDNYVYRGKKQLAELLGEEESDEIN